LTGDRLLLPLNFSDDVWSLAWGGQSILFFAITIICMIGWPYPNADFVWSDASTVC